MKNEDVDNYEDIIGLTHHVSSVRPHMPVAERAVQFAPFAALNGHSDAICETARITDKAPSLDENAVEEINEKIKYLKTCGDNAPDAVFTWFVHDLKKEGGAFVSRCSKIKRIDDFNGKIILCDGTSFYIENLCGIDFSVSEKTIPLKLMGNQEKLKHL